MIAISTCDSQTEARETKQGSPKDDPNSEFDWSEKNKTKQSTKKFYILNCQALLPFLLNQFVCLAHSGACFVCCSASMYISETI